MTVAPNRPRLAVNPIGWWILGGKTTETLGRANALLADIGYGAVKADIPVDMAARDYLPWLDSFGLQPSISLYSGIFDDPSRHAESATAAGAFAAEQAALGLDVCMLSTIVGPDESRMRHPAIGYDFDPGRLATVIEGMAAAAAAMKVEGVLAALHPHIGGWVETEDEIRSVLDGIDPGLLGFAPDTGHMSWAGMNVPAVLADYSARIVGCHLKDTFAAGIARARAQDLDYRTATAPGQIWAEPGTGQADLAACVAAFPADYRGDYMIEVDVPSVPLDQCHQIAYDWAMATLPLSGGGDLSP
jgi:inosose dehydratase